MEEYVLYEISDVFSFCVVCGFEAMKMLPRGALAEGEGFEPPVSCPTAAFKAATIDLSDILPNLCGILGNRAECVKLDSALAPVLDFRSEGGARLSHLR